MMQQLRREAPKLRLTLGCSTFVPKAHTPFQWYGVSSGEAGSEGKDRGAPSSSACVTLTLPPHLRFWLAPPGLVQRGTGG